MRLHVECDEMEWDESNREGRICSRTFLVLGMGKGKPLWAEAEPSGLTPRSVG